MRNGAIYVGSDAEIKFERSSKEANAILLRESINQSKDSFSFDFADSVLQKGDKVRITRIDEKSGGGYKDLILEEGSEGNNTQAFVHVDMVGRVTLYRTLQEAITSEGLNSLPLTKGATNAWESAVDSIEDYFQTITIKIIETGFRPFAKCTDYTVTTNRDTIDVTTLGEYFYKQWENGLIQGQGVVTALWDEKIVMGECGDPYVESRGDEVAAYFAKLILRIQIGSGFKAKFYLRSRDLEREPLEDRWAVYWAADCVCTNVAVDARPDQLLQTRIEFVTTGLFQLEIKSVPSSIAIATEAGDSLDRESDEGNLLTN